MFKRAFVVLALALAPTLLPATALAINDTAQTAQLLDASHSAVSDTLVGNSGGAFRFFAIEYAGGGVPIPITMRAQPGRGTGGVATGFKLYGPSGLIGEAIVNDQSTTDSTYAFTLAHTLPGTYYVQVYNYISGLPLNFQLNVAGLGPPPAAPAPPAPAAPAEEAPAAPSEGVPAAPAAPAAPVRPDNRTPEGAIVLTQTTSTSGGTITGKRDGNFNYFWLDYPGGRTDMTITIGYSPLAHQSDQAVGFKLFRQDPQDPNKAIIAGESAETGRNQDSATEGFTLNTDPAERYLLQVFNYLDNNITINYTLIVSGLAGPVVEAGDVSSPDRAQLLAPNAQLAARGVFKGDPSGRFQYFLFPYPGGNRVVRVNVTAAANANIGDGQFGVNLYDGANQVGTAQAGVDDRGRRSATIVINQGDARLFGIQVYNYTPGVEVQYTVAVTGV
jgi:hypothetical protein